MTKRNNNEKNLEETLETTSQGDKQRKSKKKKRTARMSVGATFVDLYKLTGETLGEGSYGKVETCVNIFTEKEFAVKIIKKTPGLFIRSKILKEIEIYHLCRGQKNIIQLIEYFEETDVFYLVFEKINGGTLLKQIQNRINFKESEARQIIFDLTEAIKHLHDKGIAHRDLKPDNILCVTSNSPHPVKLCDFDLCSQPGSLNSSSTPQLFTPVGSLEYMAPEVVDTFVYDDYYESFKNYNTLSYNKKCDLWSLGVIMYILLCGYAPFSGHCGSDCGWDQGESCQECQEELFSNIKEEKVIFDHQHWSTISPEAKDLVQNLLDKNSKIRLDVYKVLSHPWILQENINNNATSQDLYKQTDHNDAKEIGSWAMVEKRMECSPAPSISTNRDTFSFNLSKPNLSDCDILQRRRKSKEINARFAGMERVDLDIFRKMIC